MRNRTKEQIAASENQEIQVSAAFRSAQKLHYRGVMDPPPEDVTTVRWVAMQKRMIWDLTNDFTFVKWKTGLRFVPRGFER